jgi:hypothetical protein
MNIQHFDRHAHMSQETLHEIHQCITELMHIESDTYNLNNWLFGLFDGFDYTEQIISSPELAEVTHINPALGARISAVCGAVESYPKIALN